MIRSFTLLIKLAKTNTADKKYSVSPVYREYVLDIQALTTD